MSIVNKAFTFSAELWLPRPRAEIFEFFSNAHNLETITPPWVNFEVLTPQPIQMKEGTLIDYRIRVHGFPVRWRTEITEWNPPTHFVDVQLQGPYKLWHHTHTFYGKGRRHSLPGQSAILATGWRTDELALRRA